MKKRGEYARYPLLSWFVGLVERMLSILFDGHGITTEIQVGHQNFKCEPIAETESVLMLPLNIKLRPIRQFVKALNTKSESFIFLRR